MPRPETAAQLARCERSQKQLRQKHLARKMWACVRINAHFCPGGEVGMADPVAAIILRVRCTSWKNQRCARSPCVCVCVCVCVCMCLVGRPLLLRLAHRGGVSAC